LKNILYPKIYTYINNGEMTFIWRRIQICGHYFAWILLIFYSTNLFYIISNASHVTTI